ncbi:MAG TPA: hypothetical protein VF824_16625, partial [Thermoanaerobaculia bacterium]
MNRKEKLILAVAALIASVAVIFAASASRPVVPEMRKAQPDHAEIVARGKYLITVGGCNDCHTPWTIQANGKPGPD